MSNKSFQLSFIWTVKTRFRRDGEGEGHGRLNRSKDRKANVGRKNDLQERILPIDNEKQNDILVEIDGNQFSNNDFRIIQTFSEILANDDQLWEAIIIEPTHFEIENLKVTICSLETYENNLIVCE